MSFYKVYSVVKAVAVFDVGHIGSGPGRHLKGNAQPLDGDKCKATVFYPNIEFNISSRILIGWKEPEGVMQELPLSKCSLLIELTE